MVRWSAAAIITAPSLLASTTTTAPAASLTSLQGHRPTLSFPAGFLGVRAPPWSARTSSSQATSSVAQIPPYPKNLRTVGQKWWMIFHWKKIQLFLVLVQQPRMRRKRCSARQRPSRERPWKEDALMCRRCKTVITIIFKKKQTKTWRWNWSTVSRIFDHVTVKTFSVFQFVIY